MRTGWVPYIPLEERDRQEFADAIFKFEGLSKSVFE
ncbi:BnaCnng63070D [Brassica napus]|uniref:BnaCnng63070D protein n=1 Tax=Brassica napus TaxID=3708 RepID=A0A078JUU1_BRANA|nr:BnaCnng63070D [Brassica napus]